MESDTEIEQSRNEVFRKIGRNVLNFQNLERKLKFLIANGQIAGYASELEAKRERYAATVQKQTMGALVGAFVENTLTAQGDAATDSSSCPEELTEPYLSFRFSLETSAAEYEDRKQSLASIVADRNDLVHHFGTRFDLTSIAGCVDAGQYLEQQRDRFLPAFRYLSSAIDAMQDLQKRYTEFLASEDGKKQLDLLWLRQSRLVLLLGEIAAQVARPDGWTLLSIAGQRLRQHAPEDMVALQEKYGHKTLKGLVLATELFDINEEPTERGGIRVLYRIKPNWVLTYPTT